MKKTMSEKIAATAPHVAEADFKQSEKTIAALEKFYRAAIAQEAARVGGYAELSRSIGRTDTYVFNQVKRGGFSALRRIVRAIYEKG